MSKVSDFKIAESILRKICNKFNVNFVDISISFDENISGTLFIGETRNISHTTFKIVAEYISNSLDIVDKQLMPDERARDDFFVVLASNLRSFMYGDDVSNDFVDEAHCMRLYQYPLVWILLKDIICPVHNKDLVNLKIILLVEKTMCLILKIIMLNLTQMVILTMIY